MTPRPLARLWNWAYTWRRRTFLAGVVLAGLWAAVGCYQSIKPLPPDLVYRGEPTAVAGTDLRFLADLTYRDGDDVEVCEQEIFDEVLRLINGARKLLVLDLFLFNDHLGPDGIAHRPLSSEVVEGLVAARNREPEMPIVLVTDPINDVYGGDPSPQLATLREAGVQVVVTISYDCATPTRSTRASGGSSSSGGTSRRGAVGCPTPSIPPHAR